MKTYEIINLAPGTDPRSAVNKDQLDLAIQEVITPVGKRHSEYQYINLYGFMIHQIKN